MEIRPKHLTVGKLNFICLQGSEELLLTAKSTYSYMFAFSQATEISKHFILNKMNFSSLVFMKTLWYCYTCTGPKETNLCKKKIIVSASL